MAVEKGWVLGGHEAGQEVGAQIVLLSEGFAVLRQ